MGTITSGVGLVSGLNIQDLVTKLISLESGAATQLQTNIDTNTQIQQAYQSINLSIVSANLKASALGKGGVFTTRTTSTSSSAVTATAGKGASIGSFQFTPRRLVGTNQLLSSGYASDSAVIAPTATTLKISNGGFVDDGTLLSSLNGGAGVRTGSIKIVDQAGGTAVVDLTGAINVKDVINAINDSTGASITATTSGDQIKLVDNSGGSGTLQVVDLAGGKAAQDLGLTSLTQNGSSYTGQDIYNLGSDLALAKLRDGNGIRTGVGNDFSVSVGAVSFNVDVSDASTVGDVVDLINNNASNTGGRILASLSGDHLVLTDTQGTGDISVSSIGGSKAAQDLGLLNGSGAGGTLTGNDIVGSLNTVLLSTLNGGSQTSSPTPGTISVNGNNIDLSGASTLQDVIDGINNAGISGVTASVNSAGNGISVRAVGAGSLAISDVSGNLASYLNIDQSSTGSDVTINSGGLNSQYINENTRLSSYGSAAGVPKGKFLITDAAGNSATVDLTQDSDDTIGDVIQEINTRGLAVSARINDTGDGILIENTYGSGAVTVSDLNGGTTAKALKLTGTPNSDGDIDGSLAVSVSLSAGTTLSQLTTALQQAGAPLKSTILNDGSSTNPYRLNLTSNVSGSAGRLLIDTGSTNLNLSTISKGQDAVILYGSSGGGVAPVQVISSSNTFNNLVPGVSITANDTTTSPVTVTVGEDSSSITQGIQDFVDAYNSIRSYISDNSNYDQSSDKRGLLFADQTTQQVVRQLANFVNSTFLSTGSSLRTLGQVGLSLDSTGQLQFDQSAFDAAYQANPDDVEKFFTATSTGVAAKFQSVTDALTAAGEGTLAIRDTQLTNQIDRQNSTLTQIQDRLNAKEQRLYNQFYAMESALAAFQGQQATLDQLSNVASSFKSTVSSVGSGSTSK